MAGRGAGGDRPESLGGVRHPGLLPEMEYRTGILRQQAVPGPARSPGLERAECGAGAPDGLVRRDADGAVVCGQWPCRCAGRTEALLVSRQGLRTKRGEIRVLRECRARGVAGCVLRPVS